MNAQFIKWTGVAGSDLHPTFKNFQGHFSSNLQPIKDLQEPWECWDFCTTELKHAAPHKGFLLEVNNTDPASVKTEKEKKKGAIKYKDF